MTDKSVQTDMKMSENLPHFQAEEEILYQTTPFRPH